MYLRLKRIGDIFCAVIAGLLLSPLLIILAVIVKVTSKGTVLFKQKRAGRDGTFFFIYKFRTMRSDTPSDIATHLLENPYSYITPIGRFLRKSSLDELPQLWNILIGDMGFVGPRPALWNQDDLITEREKYGANSIRPGLTGLAQVNGGDILSIPVKAAFDGEYVQKVSLRLDIKIIFFTIYCVFTGYGTLEGKQ